MFLKTSLKGCFQNQQNYKCLKLTNVIGIFMGSYLFINLVSVFPFNKNKQNIFMGWYKMVSGKLPLRKIAPGQGHCLV